ncbi:hypothetical protein ACFY4C_39875 [Actinomadura viridis]|uniref:hypothetical protein n=1 Tax=Actinomadura viridis TaxID=58110 RepID=UPI0036C93DCA
MKRIAILAAAMGVAGGLALAPATASASEVGVQGCQGASATLTYRYYTSPTTTADWKKNCSGNWEPPYAQGYYLYAGGWSGNMYFEDGTRLDFCDWKNYPIGKKRAISITLSSTKASHCK